MKTPSRKKKSYIAGDVFAIPSLDGRFYLGQIAACTKSEIGANFCYLFREKLQSIDAFAAVDIAQSEVIGAMLITPELLLSGAWRVLGHCEIHEHRAFGRLTELRQKSYVGATIVGAGLVGEYMDTFFGLIDDSKWPDPSYVYKHFLVPCRQTMKTKRE